MKRLAFTMIELIFVIVILGILAAVAIPKLAATRDDAKVSMIAYNTMTAAFEIAAYAMAQGRTETLLGEMSRAMKTLESRGYASESGSSSVNIRSEAGEQTCLIMRIENSGGDVETLSLVIGSATDDNCVNLRQLINFDSYPMPLRGNFISL